MPASRGARHGMGAETFNVLISLVCDRGVMWTGTMSRDATPAACMHRIGFALMLIRRPGRWLQGIWRPMRVSGRVGESYRWPFGRFAFRRTRRTKHVVGC